MRANLLMRTRMPTCSCMYVRVRLYACTYVCAGVLERERARVFTIHTRLPPRLYSMSYVICHMSHMSHMSLTFTPMLRMQCFHCKPMLYVNVNFVLHTLHTWYVELLSPRHLPASSNCDSFSNDNNPFCQPLFLHT